ncbi:MAG: hypothetical protein AAB444_02545 [Patescibacteria group bacterium]
MSFTDALVYFAPVCCIIAFAWIAIKRFPWFKKRFSPREYKEKSSDAGEEAGEESKKRKRETESLMRKAKALRNNSRCTPGRKR